MEQTSRLSIVIDANGAERSLSRLKSVLAQVENTGDETGQSLQDLGRNANNAGRQAGNASRGMQGLTDAFQKVWAVAGVALAGVGFALTGVIKEATNFEKAMAGVKKVIDFPTPQAFKQMEKDILAMSQRLPMTAEGLANIMASAGQAGIAQADLSRFTETAAKMGIAFDITAEQAGQAMAEMRVAFKMSQTDVETLADKINYLGNTTPNTAAKIMEVVQRVGALGGIAGVSSDQIAALAGSITAVEPEVAATGLKNMMLALTKSESATKAQIKAFESLGLSVKDVAKNMQIDSMGTFLNIIEKIKTLPKDIQVATINDIFGSESLPVISQLISNTDALKTNLKAVGDNSKYAGSMMKEFESMAGTSANQTQLFSNNMTAVKIALGAALLPAINDVMKAITPVLQAFAQWASENPKTVATIVGITTALLAVVAAAGGLGLMVAGVIAGFAALATVTAPVWGTVAAIAAVGAAVIALAVNWEEFNNALGKILYYMVEDVKAKWQAIQDAIGGTIYEIVESAKEKWQSLKDTVGNIANGIGQTVGDKFNQLKSIATTAFNALPTPIQAALSTVGNVIKAQFALIKNIFTTTFNVIKALVRGDMQGVKNAIQQGMTNAWNIVKTMVTNIVGSFKNLGKQLLQAGKDAIQGLIDGISSKFRAVQDKVSEIAGLIPSAVKYLLDIRSPSRVMKELGEWAALGLAEGMKNKTSIVAKNAQQMADEARKAVIDSISSVKREIFTLTHGDNPILALGYDIGMGKYGNSDTKPLMELTKQKYILEQTKPLLDEIANINREIQTHGLSKLQIFEMDAAKGKYADVLPEVISQYRQMLQIQEQFNALLEKRNRITSTNEAIAKDYREIQSQLPNQMDPLVQLDQEHQARLAKIKAYYESQKALASTSAEQLKTIEQETTQTAFAIQEQYQQQKSQLILAQAQSTFGQYLGLVKAFAGENSHAYRAMFALEKAFAVAQIIMANKTTLAKAWASAPFPANLGAVAKAAVESGALLSAVQAINPKGFKTGGYTGNFGTNQIAGVVHGQEYVLNANATKRIGIDNLNRLNRGDGIGSNQIVNIHVTVNQDGSSDVKASHEIGKNLGNAIKLAVQNELQKERRQGGLLYGR